MHLDGDSCTSSPHLTLAFYHLVCFHTWQAQVIVTKVHLFFNGAKSNTGGSNTKFAMTIRHNGSPTIKAVDGMLYKFSHHYRDTLFTYNPDDQKQIFLEGDLGGGDCPRCMS